MKNSYKVIILAVLVLIVVGLVYWLWFRSEPVPDAPSEPLSGGVLHSLEFMTDGDKKALGLPLGTRAQVISREADGEISVYKIIRNDSDIVADPSRLAPISPRAE